ncbi:MAG: DMT family transporter [Gemmatimonadales bacterium]
MTPSAPGPAPASAPAVASAPALGAGTAFTLLAAFGFAAVSTLTLVATAEHVPLFSVLMWRNTLASVALVGFVGTRGYARIPPREVMRFIAIGGGGQALFTGLALTSLRYITAAELAFLFYTYPAWVAVVQMVRGAERLTTTRAVALLLSFGGIVVMKLGPAAGSVAAGAGPPLSAPAWHGVAMALSAAVTYGLYIPTMQHLQKHHPVPVTSAYAKLGAALCFLLLASATQTFTYTITPKAWEAIAALAIFSTVLPSVFFLMGLMRLGPVRTAIVSTVEPFLTTLLGWLVLGQPITPGILVGGAMIVTAVSVLQFRRERVA